MGIDPALHHNIVSDLRSEIASLREQLKNQGSSNLAGTLGVGTEEPIYSKPIDTISMASSSTEYSEPWQDPDIEIGEAFETEFKTSKQIEPSAPPLSVFSSLEDLHISEANSLSEEEQAIDDSSGYSSGSDRVSNWSDEDSISDTNSVASEEELQSKHIVSEIIQDELVDIKKELKLQGLAEEEAVESVEDILGQDLITDIVEKADANNSRK